MRTRSRVATHACPCPRCEADPSTAEAREHAAIRFLAGTLDEKMRRRFVGLWALHLGHGGVQQMARITGLDRNTIARGRREVVRLRDPLGARVRAPGAGRKPAPKNSQGFAARSAR